jgi:hypothetical protein
MHANKYYKRVILSWYALTETETHMKIMQEKGNGKWYLRHSNISLGDGRAIICGGGSCTENYP